MIPLLRLAGVLAVGCALVLPWTPSPAHAQDAEGLVIEGIELRREGRDAEALAKFEQAYEMDGSARALAQIALAEQALGRWVEAHEHLTEARARGGDWIEDRREALDRAMTVIRDRVGRVSVEADAPKARVAVGDREHPAGEPFAVEPGEVQLVVSAPDRGQVARTVTVAAGEHRSLEVALPKPERSTDTAAAAPGTSTQPEPSDDDTTVARAPSDASPQNEGTDITPVLGWIAVGTAAVAVGGGIAAWRIREDRAQTHNDRDCPPPEVPNEPCAELRSEVDRAEAASIATLTIGGALAAAGIVLLALPSGSDDEREAVRCTPGPGEAGVACRWRF